MDCRSVSAAFSIRQMSVCVYPTSISTAGRTRSGSGMMWIASASCALTHMEISTFMEESMRSSSRTNDSCTYICDTVALSSSARAPSGTCALSTPPILNRTGVLCMRICSGARAFSSDMEITSSMSSTVMRRLRDSIRSVACVVISLTNGAGTESATSRMRMRLCCSAVSIAVRIASPRDASSENSPPSNPEYSQIPTPCTRIPSVWTELPHKQTTFELPISSIAAGFKPQDSSAYKRQPIYTQALYHTKFVMRNRSAVICIFSFFC